MRERGKWGSNIHIIRRFSRTENVLREWIRERERESKRNLCNGIILKFKFNFRSCVHQESNFFLVYSCCLAAEHVVGEGWSVGEGGIVGEGEVLGREVMLGRGRECWVGSVFGEGWSVGERGSVGEGSSVGEGIVCWGRSVGEYDNNCLTH